jgi:pilus assembly protein CpaE
MIHHPHLLQETGVIVLVTEFTLAAARDTIRLLSWFKSNAPQSRVVLVANKVQQIGQEIARKDFEQSIERKIDLLIPYDPKAAAQAAKLGKAVSDAARGTKLGQALAQVGRIVLAGVDAAADMDAMPVKGGAKAAKAAKAKAAPAAESGTGGSLVGRLVDFRKLLPKRAPKAPKPPKAAAAAKTNG